jgi:hypothetical protein
MRRVVIAAAFVAGTIVAQSLPAKKPSAAPPPAPKISVSGKSAEAEIADLRKQLADLKKTVEDNDVNIWSSIQRQVEDIYKLQHETIELDPSSPGAFQRVDSRTGPLLVSLTNVEPYLDGFKVILKIGNPLAIEYKGFKMKANYSPRQRSGEKWMDWYNKRKAKEFSFSQSLYPGQWNIIELIFPDTKPDAFGWISLSLETDRISLK